MSVRMMAVISPMFRSHRSRSRISHCRKIGNFLHLLDNPDAPRYSTVLNWSNAFLSLPSGSRAPSKSYTGAQLEMARLKTRLPEIVNMISKIDGSIKLCMEMRSEIALIIANKDYLELKNVMSVIDSHLREYLYHALCEDSLSLKRITFEESSGLVLEKVAKFDAVHTVRSISELKRRLHDGRRCYAFFHSRYRTIQ